MQHVFILLVLLGVSSVDGGNKRFLHPIFPDDTSYQYPPPQNNLLPPPPDAEQDEPFFPEDSIIVNQTQTPPPPSTNESVSISTATKPTKPSKRAVIAISLGIGILSSTAALLFLIYRLNAKKKPLDEDHRKTETTPQPIPSSFLYIGTVDDPQRPKFRAPPPPPNVALLQSVTNTKVSPTASMPAQGVNVSPKVRSTWTSYIKPPSEPRFEDTKPRLKALHWDKVRVTSDRATAWDHLKPSSFQLNEDVMETLFGCNANNSNKPLTTTRSLQNEKRILDPKKSQNVAILARALNVTLDEVSQALFDGDSEALGAELLETLLKMAPTKEEEIRLKAYKGDTSNLGYAEKFLKAILDIPFAFTRVEAMLYRENFDAEIKYLTKSFQTLEEASSELKNSRLFIKLLEAVLTTGNRMNAGTNRGGAKAFRLDTLLKLEDIKGADGKTTLLHFVVQEVIRSQDMDFVNVTDDKEVEFRRQGVIVVARLDREIGKVKLAAGMNSDALRSNVSKLETELHKLKTLLQYESSEMKGKFLESMQTFVKKAEEEVCRIKKIERKALTLVREVTEYFHGGDAVKEEAHPLRIFMIVRDFISTLDHMCKDSTVMCADRSFRISSLPVLGRYNVIKNDSSSEGVSRNEKVRAHIRSFL